ncbi:SGNH/GDSL hydrolase family protein [Actinokineospora auranticolor]|uniref:Lysophospholipase L1-like esterase n=1 Tax=Actinokineospora auranticolor TaxID=155976 RepID=A0A2S6GVB9_9PSEU|nr:SGNH/GDSL hydrolase family protein [Actinokineospora auranticolor]PPK69164.1 lysophospholipase L1-like esterase [Actinokineospora auranticolor]
MSHYSSLVAVGDSFTEGMSDYRPDGTCRGWADLVAARLAADTPGFRYANLAVRGKLVRQIVDEQVDPAAAMRPDLVTFAGGLNDVMRPGCDLNAVTARVSYAVRTLAASAKQVVLFRVADPSRRMRGSTRIMPRINHLLAVVDRLAEEHDAVVVDLFSSPVFDSPALWAEDRIHLNTEGHRRVAEATLRALRVAPSFEWDAALPHQPQDWRDRAKADLQWARTHAGPWIARRLTGRSSGDGRQPKRPELDPFTG